jgi:NAD(P)-dependent dehydrogenase (short-subunit alcohol dehydrogenase family)
MMLPEAYDLIPVLRFAVDLFDIQGRVAVVVGGAGRMGREFAHVLGNAGARVVVLDLHANNAALCAAQVEEETGAETLALSCDAGNSEEVAAGFREIGARWGEVRILVYVTMSKPPGYYAPAENYQQEVWREVMRSNLDGAFFCSREAARLMPRGGSIVFASSTYAIVGPDHRIYQECLPGGNIYSPEEPLSLPTSYSAAKAGLIGLARNLATLWADRQIRVNTLVPGGVYDGQEEPFHRAYVSRTPLGRMAVWSDYNGPLLFLVSDASRYMTGQVLVVDGGWTTW